MKNPDANPSFFDFKFGLIILLAGVVVINQIWLFQLSKSITLQASHPDYQFGLLLKDSEDAYWQAFKAGADRAAVFYKSSLYTQFVNELKAPENEDPTLTLERMSFSKLDGIVGYVNPTENYGPVIDETVAAGIPVIAVENDVTNSKRNMFVGYNAYNYGVEAGKRMVEALNGRGNIAIVMNQSESESKNIQNLKLSGFLSVINQNKNIILKDTILSNSGVYGTQELVEKLVNSGKNISGIYITNETDTRSVVELLVENNKVNAYKIIGSGDSKIIEDYVNKNILYASVFVDGYEMGFKSVEALVKLRQGETLPSYLDSTIGVITPQEMGR